MSSGDRQTPGSKWYLKPPKKWFKSSSKNGSSPQLAQPSIGGPSTANASVIELDQDNETLTGSPKSKHSQLNSKSSSSPESLQYSAHSFTALTDAEQDDPRHAIQGEYVSEPLTSTVRTAIAIVKDYGKVALNFTEMLLKKLPDAVDDNPVKMAFVIVKVILEIKEGVQDNKEIVVLRIIWMAEQLRLVEESLSNWNPAKEEETKWIDEFKRALEIELKNLLHLKEQSLGRRIANQEEDQRSLAQIFERINAARVQLELATGLRVFKIVTSLQEKAKNILLERLKPCPIADYKFYPEGEEQQVLRRAICSPNTRKSILRDVYGWVNDVSLESPPVYWLYGPTGTGKTTIAHTVARRFELAPDVDDTTVLGGNFFCSRQFSGTKSVKSIVGTIAYHLALKSRPFAEALEECDATLVHRDPRTQIEGLLVKPWNGSFSVQRTKPYLIVVDALDELSEEGGTEFLRALVDVVNQNRLPGLKFFATSRPYQPLINQVQLLKSTLQKRFRLQDVPTQEIEADIHQYLTTALPQFATRDELGVLVKRAAGLFIYASTIVKYLAEREGPFQEDSLVDLASASDTAVSQDPSEPQPLRALDTLYHQIISDAVNPHKHERQAQLGILHTFLTSTEPTSTSVVSELLFSPRYEKYVGFADSFLLRLHAVLYVENGKVLFYHKSFSDFLSDNSRSEEFHCSLPSHHRRIAESCFGIMKTLHFNMANIPSSFVLDRDNPTLEDQIQANISPGLSYSCRNWDQHLIASAPASSDPIPGFLSEFLELRVLFWIEAMNLLGQVGRCDPMLRAARQYTKESENSSPLVARLGEAASFALYFSSSPASASTPHLYISSLATWPRRSGIFERWRKHFPRIPKFTNVSQGGALLMTLAIQAPVNEAAFSKDGSRIASGSYDNLVRVWDSSTGAVKNVLTGHTAWVQSVAFSPDGKHVVSGGGDKSVRVWDLSSGKAQYILEGHKEWVCSVAFSPDGKRIVSGSDDCSIRVWDSSTGKEIMVIDEEDRVSSVAFSPDGSLIVSGSNKVNVWDSTTGELEIQCKSLGHTDLVCSVAFAPDGSRIVSGSVDASVRVWDAFTGEAQLVLDDDMESIHAVTFSPDGHHIVSGSFDRSVRMWDSRTGEEQAVFDGHTARVLSVAFSGDGSRLVSSSDDKTVRVWDSSAGDNHSESSRTFPTDGDRIIPDSYDTAVHDGHTAGVLSVAFSPDGRKIASGSFDESVRVWDSFTGELQAVLEGYTDAIWSISFTPDGSRLVSGSGDRVIRLWDSSTGELVNVFHAHSSGIWSISIPLDGSRIVSGSDDNSIRLWNLWTGEVSNAIESQTDAVFTVAFSPDGKRFVSGGESKTGLVWDVGTGEVQNKLLGHTEFIRSVAFSPDGTRIATGSHDDSVRVWNSFTGEEESVLEGHEYVVYSVAFSPDSSRIVSSSADHTVRVWDASTGDLLIGFDGHMDHVRSVAFSPDGNRIVSGSSDKSVRVWDALTDNVLHTVTFSANGKRIESTSLSDDSLDHVSRHRLEPFYVWESLKGYQYQPKYSGWLISPHQKEYLMFIPPDEHLPTSTQLLVMPHSFAASVDLTNSSLGSSWYKCYSS